MIAELTGKYRFLSNFWSCIIPYDGELYPSVENAYQATKCFNKQDRVRFLDIKAGEAKRLGRVIKMQPNWDEIKLDVMLRLVRIKFNDPTLRKLLIATGYEEIQEGNWWGDSYWGTVNGVGDNHLGVILMKVRNEAVADDIKK
jgi:ribA/ribD-fused uncharacterized protein